MKKKVFTVSEDTEIILNGKKFLLESGDKIMLEDKNYKWARDLTSKIINDIKI